MLIRNRTLGGKKGGRECVRGGTVRRDEKGRLSGKKKRIPYCGKREPTRA